MRFFRISLALLCLAGGLLACQPQPAVISTVTPRPTPHLLQVQITPALRWLGPVFQACAAQQSRLGIALNERPAAALDVSQADFAFTWGSTQGASGARAFVVGSEDLVLVVNAQNPVRSLGLAQVQDLFGGKAGDWSQLKSTPAFSAPVSAYIYAKEDDIWPGLAVLVNPGGQALLAPDPQALRTRIAGETGAIGFLPARWVDASVSAVTIMGVAPENLRRPLLALSSGEPRDEGRSWLLCVQEKLR